MFSNFKDFNEWKNCKIQIKNRYYLKKLTFLSSKSKPFNFWKNIDHKGSFDKGFYGFYYLRSIILKRKSKK